MVYNTDPIHSKVSKGLKDSHLINTVRQDKYAYEGETSMEEIATRVVKGVFKHKKYAGSPLPLLVRDAIVEGLFMPAGRILAGAGTAKNVTLMNCYVNQTIEDSMGGIMDALKSAAITMQYGGGVGTDFSTIRPTGATLKRLGAGAQASGPMPFMDMWDAMCATVTSAGNRRGAMMGTISDSHPDLLNFIDAKKTKGRLTNFNISILVSDAFMEAVADNEEWLLYFHVPPVTREALLPEYDFTDDDGVEQFVYSVHNARDLWEQITRTTYEYSEPGVIFIDRVNSMNNLQDIETIRCTNPCGEQPLPPHGTCNLGAVILSRMVRNPFTEDAFFDFALLREIVNLGVEFLDNVIEATNYPHDEQHKEEINKRRLGLGIAGLADALAQLGIRYGSLKAARVAEEIMKTIAIQAYGTSTDLAHTEGPFPLWKKGFGDKGFIAEKLPKELRDRISTEGIRNALLLTVAPTGTTSIVFGNISSGVEPVFAYTQKRKVRQPDNSLKEYIEDSYLVRLYKQFIKHDSASEQPLILPPYFVTAADLTAAEHVRMQAACQAWVDASVSKTVNCPTEMTYDDFCEVYTLAYTSGCKGCATYRPSAVRGSILEDANKQPIDVIKALQETLGSDAVRNALIASNGSRPAKLEGTTYKVRWPSMSAAMYITINVHPETKAPYEMFFASKDARHSDWMTALTLMISGILRSGISPHFIAHELKQVSSMHDTAWIDGKFYQSPVAYIGCVIETSFAGTADPSVIQEPPDPVPQVVQVSANVKGEVCPQCHAPGLIHSEGCKKCINCAYSNCN